jgi:hypothetical protein
MRLLAVLPALCFTVMVGIAYSADLGKGKPRGAREPFQFFGAEDFVTGSLASQDQFDVPSGKRLVIEHVSANLEFPIDQELTSTVVNTTVNEVEVPHQFAIPFASTFEDRLRVHTGGQQVRLYADPGTTVIVLANRNSDSCPQTPCGSMRIFISGYLLPVDSPSLAP